MPSPGQVFYLSPEAGEEARKGDRPHVLLSVSRPGSEVVTLAYGSTKETDARRGAAHVMIHPGSHPRSGLIYPTLFYTSHLVSYAADALSRPIGQIFDFMPVLRASLRMALGIGTGVTNEGNFPGANRRGRVVELTREHAADQDARYGLVVTQPTYSRTGFQQTVIPLLDNEFEPADLDVVIPGTSRLAQLGSAIPGGMLAPSMISTVYQPDHIARYLGLVVEPEMMRQVDEALELHFGL
jgi:mRNA-degrading endonuclease toxin of MazEF toxin-antitoxin module